MGTNTDIAAEADVAATTTPPLNLRDRLLTSRVAYRISALRRPQKIALTTAGVLLAGSAGYLTFGPTATSTSTPPADSNSYASPADGDLTIGDVTVEQMIGTCTEVPVESDKANQGGKSCSYAPSSSELPRITAPAGTLAMNSGTSTAYSVSVVDVTAPTKPAPITTSGKTLLFPAAPVGDYRVTAIGDGGGAWQFILTVRPGTAAPVAETPAR